MSEKGNNNWFKDSKSYPSYVKESSHDIFQFLKSDTHNKETKSPAADYIAEDTNIPQNVVYGYARLEERYQNLCQTYERDEEHLNELHEKDKEISLLNERLEKCLESKEEIKAENAFISVVSAILIALGTGFIITDIENHFNLFVGVLLIIVMMILNTHKFFRSLYKNKI